VSDEQVVASDEIVSEAEEWRVEEECITSIVVSGWW
jgi:hypothetical protein